MEAAPQGSRRVAVVRPYRHISPSSSSSGSIQPPDIVMDDDMEDAWPIRAGYLNVTLAHVACEDEETRLHEWLELFSPSSQPQSDEEHFYINTMNLAIQEKLSLLQ